MTERAGRRPVLAPSPRGWSRRASLSHHFAIAPSWAIVWGPPVPSGWAQGPRRRGGRPRPRHLSLQSRPGARPRAPVLQPGRAQGRSPSARWSRPAIPWQAVLLATSAVVFGFRRHARCPDARRRHGSGEFPTATSNRRRPRRLRVSGSLGFTLPCDQPIVASEVGVTDWLVHSPDPPPLSTATSALALFPGRDGAGRLGSTRLAESVRSTFECDRRRRGHVSGWRAAILVRRSPMSIRALRLAGLAAGPVAPPVGMAVGGDLCQIGQPRSAGISTAAVLGGSVSRRSWVSCR